MTQDTWQTAEIETLRARLKAAEQTIRELKDLMHKREKYSLDIPWTDKSQINQDLSAIHSCL